jgi:predicted nucleotidyltransferase component of viral defense system
MFRREIYRTMARVLEGLHEEVLARTSFRFAGGTCLALAHGEYRVSRDLDFVCSDPKGYAELRSSARDHGYAALFSPEARTSLGFPREIRVDQYGLRFPVVVDGTTIRVEMIREARITLGPAAAAEWTRVPILSLTDTFAEKLLANSDRWADRDDLSRDLLDLAVLRSAHGPIPEAAWVAAESAYGTAPRQDLRKSADRFLADQDYQRRCFTGLDIEGTEGVLQGVRVLRADLEAPPGGAGS